MGLIPNPKDSKIGEWITCELVGRKHQTNMDGVPCDHGLIPHYAPFLPEIKIGGYDHFVKLVQDECFEGTIFRHPNGTRYKLRCEMVGVPDCWTSNKKKKPMDDGVTTIRPKVSISIGLIEWGDDIYIVKTT